MTKHPSRSIAQPQPQVPSLTRRMVKAHALRMFQDVLPLRELTVREWRQAEADLARKIEDGSQ